MLGRTSQLNNGPARRSKIFIPLREILKIQKCFYGWPQLVLPNRYLIRNAWCFREVRVCTAGEVMGRGGCHKRMKITKNLTVGSCAVEPFRPPPLLKCTASTPHSTNPYVAHVVKVET